MRNRNRPAGVAVPLPTGLRCCFAPRSCSPACFQAQGGFLGGSLNEVLCLWACVLKMPSYVAGASLPGKWRLFWEDTPWAVLIKLFLHSLVLMGNYGKVKSGSF